MLTTYLTESEFAAREEALAEWAEMLQAEENAEAEREAAEAEWASSIDPHVMYGVSRNWF